MADPLRDLPDLHAVLDVAELMFTEHADKDERDKLQRTLYMPKPGEIPAGFDGGQVDDAFAAFSSASSGFT